MCGIIAILRRASDSPIPPQQAIIALVRQACGDLERACAEKSPVRGLISAAANLRKVDRQLKTPGGVVLLVREHSIAETIATTTQRALEAIDALESQLEANNGGAGAEEVEAINAAMVEARDALWAVGTDRLNTARAVAELGAGQSHLATVRALLTVQQALSALDRLEVRGRDSAGLALLVSGHELDFDSAEWKDALRTRLQDPLLRNRAVRTATTPAGTVLCLIYKTAAEIGELGDNVAQLRASLQTDPLLHAAIRSGSVELAALAHTRWASVGVISEANAHPLDEREEDRATPGPPVLAALNGDVDNYGVLKQTAQLLTADEVTTDAKVIPPLISRRMMDGLPFEEAFRETVASFVGSVAIAAAPLENPDRLALALHGSGQALYVGLGEEVFVVASEPYGLVEETPTYLRLDGETPGNPDHPSSRGQVVVLDRRRAGTLEGVERWGYDGTPLPLSEAELKQAEITTRDVDRGSYPHYLLKEISEAPRSFSRTLRGRLRRGAEGRLSVVLDRQALPEPVVSALEARRVRRVIVVGQGTAAVAGAGVAQAIEWGMAESGVVVTAMPGTELSGFHLRDDMSDTLVIAISQSGTTTDTNRTVDLVRSRGARVIAIVNRRSSDLTHKADGVLYTSDGRDVEMSVASTKAFYSQIAAGFLLAVAVGELVEGAQRTPARDREVQALLAALRSLPDAMRSTLSQSSNVALVAARHAPQHRYWALVGNGWNRVAAQEIRIKLSELCYKSIACDATEDKKHIDLSSEPLILVCAAGLSGSTASDVGKEVAIYRAHKATPIVIATAGSGGFDAASERLEIPPTHPTLAFVLTALVGHLFGYHAAMAIDRQARPLRAIRSAIEKLASEVAAGEPVDDLLGSLSAAVEEPVQAFLDEFLARRYDGHLEAATAVALVELLRFVEGSMPLASFRRLHGKPGSPEAVIEALIMVLTKAIDELTRPVDAIKHQAKTVTVGISRSDEALLVTALVRETLAAGAAREHLDYQVLRALAALDPVVTSVDGFTHYRIEGQPRSDRAVIQVLDQGGVAASLPSRTKQHPVLKGTKRRVAFERQILIARGASDGRLVVLVPELDSTGVCGLVLLHVTLSDKAPVSVLRGVLKGYRGRYEQIRDAVTETQPELVEGVLEDISVERLLTAPVREIASEVVTKMTRSSSG